MVELVERVSDTIFSLFFSPFTAHAIEYEGVVYPTVEHAYHALRYNESVIREEIRNARSPYLAWSISQKHKSHQRPDFPERKVMVMKELCRLKVKQHVDVRESLLRTGTQRIVKHIVAGPRSDGFWDDGGDGSGKNTTGIIWMELRDEFQPQKRSTRNEKQETSN